MHAAIRCLDNDLRQTIPIQIGNHEDWPSILLTCLRKELMVLPLEQSISNQQRDAAFVSVHVNLFYWQLVLKPIEACEQLFNRTVVTNVVIGLCLVCGSIMLALRLRLA